MEFPVSTVDDIISELSEDFEATLSNPSPGAMLGNRTALISIADNDGNNNKNIENTMCHSKMVHN